MSASPEDGPVDIEQLSREVWLLMSDLVLDHARRREVADSLGMSFGKTRAIRRLAHRSMAMGELAVALDIDPPNATAVVNELERQGLVQRKAHPTDRRLRLVELTRKGRALAAKADGILARPPGGLSDLSRAELTSLLRTLRRVGAPKSEAIRPRP